MKLTRIFAAAFLACFISSASFASTVRLDVSGTIYYSEDLDGGPIRNGQRVSASYVFDADAAALAQGGGNIFPLVSATFVYEDLGRSTVFDSSIWSSPFINTITAWGDFLSGKLQFQTSDGIGSTSALIVYLPTGQGIDNSTMRPLVSVLAAGGLSALSKTNLAFFGVGFDGSGWWGDCPFTQTNCQYYTPIDTLTITDVQAVPVPAALPLMGLGLLGLGFAGRRRKV